VDGSTEQRWPPQPVPSSTQPTALARANRRRQASVNQSGCRRERDAS
jgi:hypothetical protein